MVLQHSDEAPFSPWLLRASSCTSRPLSQTPDQGHRGPACAAPGCVSVDGERRKHTDPEAKSTNSIEFGFQTNSLFPSPVPEKFM